MTTASIDYVQIGEIPLWFRERAVNHCEKIGKPGFLDSIAPSRIWGNHWGTSRRPSGPQVFVTEPVLRDGEAERFAKEVAEKLRVQYRVRERGAARSSKAATRVEFFI